MKFIVKKHRTYLSEDEKALIIKLHNEGYTKVRIGKILNRSDSCVGRYLHQCGYKKNNKNRIKLINKDVENIILRYKNGECARKIYLDYKDKVGCEETIINVLKREGVEIRPRGLSTFLNKDYFRIIDTEDKAYYLGLLLADGNVYEHKNKKHYTISISLKLQDKYILDSLCEFINSASKVHVYERKNKKYKTIDKSYMAQYSVQSSAMAYDLIKLGVVPKKSLIAELTDLVPEHLYHHYLRGYFDGNGSVYITKKDNKIHFAFYGNHKILHQIKQKLKECISINDNKITDQKKANVSLMSFSSKKDIINFYNYIYNNANYYLQRKKNIFDEYLKSSK